MPLKRIHNEELIKKTEVILNVTKLQFTVYDLLDLIYKPLVFRELKSLLHSVKLDVKYVTINQSSVAFR